MHDRFWRSSSQEYPFVLYPLQPRFGRRFASKPRLPLPGPRLAHPPFRGTILDLRFPAVWPQAFVIIDGLRFERTRIEDVVKNYLGAATLGPWEQWLATLAPRQHTIVLGASGDTDKDSTGIFDAIRVSAIPDGGSSAVLLSLSLECLL